MKMGNRPLSLSSSSLGIASWTRGPADPFPPPPFVDAPNAGTKEAAPWLDLELLLLLDSSPSASSGLLMFSSSWPMEIVTLHSPSDHSRCWTGNAIDLAELVEIPDFSDPGDPLGIGVLFLNAFGVCSLISSFSFSSWIGSSLINLLWENHAFIVFKIRAPKRTAPITIEITPTMNTSSSQLSFFFEALFSLSTSFRG